MKIYYVANNQLPTRKAHGLQIVRMCEAFTRAGADVELIIPQRTIDPGIEDSDVARYYGVQYPFRISRVRTLSFLLYDWHGSFINHALFWVQQLAFAWAVRWHLRGRSGAVYSRDPFILALLPRGGMKCFWEMHSLPENFTSWFYRRVRSRVAAIFTITEGLAARVRSAVHCPVSVVPDGFDPRDFAAAPSRSDARTRLGIAPDAHIALYAGHLYDWKGADTFAAAAALTPEVTFVCVGGLPEDVALFRERFPSKNLQFVGHVSRRDVVAYLRAADVVVLPNSARLDISRLYTSPLKLFEYMASGTPIVASDLPSLREVLHGESAYFVPPDSPRELARGIEHVLHDTLAHERAARALADVQQYTWDARAARILAEIS